MFTRLLGKPLFLLIAFAFALGWFLLSSKDAANNEGGKLVGELTHPEPQSLVSAIQPVSTADAADAADSQAPEVAFRPTDEFNARFEQANVYAENDNANMARLHYQDLIRDFPQAVEPYVNLAVLFAQESQLEMAQKTLTNGLNANKSYAALFANLQKVLGALAANAYKEALQENGERITTLELPLLKQVHSGGASSERLVSLEDQLQAVQSEVAQSRQFALQADAEQKKVVELQTELGVAKQSLITLENEYQEKLAALQVELDKQTLTASNLAALNKKQQSEITDAQQVAANKLAEIEKAERDRLAAIQAEKDTLAQQQALAVAEQEKQQQAERDRLAKLQAEQDSKAKQQSLAAAAARAKAEEKIQAQRALAIEHVSRWAKAWSDQSVSDYVASYADGYRPAGRGLSHAQWREQRRERLLNKSSISVDVSDFKISKTAQGFDVSFLQHYKADNIDDRIRKRLSFVAPTDDWTTAKIVGEKIIR